MKLRRLNLLLTVVLVAVSASTMRASVMYDLTIDLSALRKKPMGPSFHAAFEKATNSVLVAASRWAFSRRYLRFLYPRPRLSSILIFPLMASTTPSGTLIWQ